MVIELVPFLAVLSILGAAWWLSLRALDWASGKTSSEADRVGGVDRFARHWPGEEIPVWLRRALRTHDAAGLAEYYCQLKELSTAADNFDTSCAFQEALVSLALAEAIEDIAKAHRGLEAVRRLQHQITASGTDPRLTVLDLMECRLRLVLAHAGQEPRQHTLAMQALARAESGRESGGGRRSWV